MWYAHADITNTLHFGVDMLTILSYKTFFRQDNHTKYSTLSISEIMKILSGFYKASLRKSKDLDGIVPSILDFLNQ